MFRYALTDSCFLRLFEESDAEELVRVITSNRAHLVEWLPWVDATSTTADTLEFIRRTRRQIVENDGFQAAIVDADEIIGAIGFHGVDRNHRATSIGYWLSEDRQGRGVMTEAVRALTAHAFDVWELNRVEIRVAVGNLRSRAIPHRLGFLEEGVLQQAEWHGERFRDIVVYAMLAHEWARAR